MPWYSDPILLSLLAVLLVLGVLVLLASIRSGCSDDAEREGPDSFEVTGANGKLRTISRSPVRDPLPDPDTAPGEDRPPPRDFLLPEVLRDSARALGRTPR